MPPQQIPAYTRLGSRAPLALIRPWCCCSGCCARCHAGCCAGCHLGCCSGCHAGSAAWPHPMARLGAIFGPGWPEQSRAGSCHRGDTAPALWFFGRGHQRPRLSPCPRPSPRGTPAAPRGSWCLLLGLPVPRLLLELSMSESVLNKQTTKPSSSQPGHSRNWVFKRMN